MSLPLIVTDESGTVLYKARGISASAAQKTALAAAATERKRGLVRLAGANLYIKEVPLAGKHYLFFMDFDALCACYGVAAAERAAAGLFDPAPYSAAAAETLPLKTLALSFAKAYADRLREAGIRLELRGLSSDVCVTVPPNAFALCLTLAVRLCAAAGEHVRLSFIKSLGRVTVFADAVDGAPRRAAEEPVLRVLLYEVAAAAGFSVEETPCGGFAIDLSPFDIALAGFKADHLRALSRNFCMYALFFG